MGGGGWGGGIAGGGGERYSSFMVPVSNQDKIYLKKGVQLTWVSYALISIVIEIIHLTKSQQ